MGLVSSVCFAELGHSVNLIEIDENKSKAINSGKSPIYESGLEDLLSSHIGRNLHASTDYDAISSTDMSIICVGTPLGADKRLDLSIVASASKSIGEHLKDRAPNAYHVVVLKSTVPPGTTEEIVIPAVLRNSGKGMDEIGFAMNPEFLREGLAIYDFMNPDRIIIGSHDKRAGDLVESAYQNINSPIIRTRIKSAEMIKYSSNAFLAAKISFANEIGNICKRLGIDVYEVMQGVGLDSRIGSKFLNAGVGFGGSCFPKDVSALIQLSCDLGVDPVFLSSIIEVNERQPARMVEMLQSRMNELEGKRVAVLGLAFKDGTDDVRESRAIPVIRALRKGHAKVAAYDPMASGNMEKIFPDIEYCQSAADALRGADACLVVTEWPEFGKLDREFELMRSRIIIEGRRILSCRDKEGICW